MALKLHFKLQLNKINFMKNKVSIFFVVFLVSNITFAQSVNDFKSSLIADLISKLDMNYESQSENKLLFLYFNTKVNKYTELIGVFNFITIDSVILFDTALLNQVSLRVRETSGDSIIFIKQISNPIEREMYINNLNKLEYSAFANRIFIEIQDPINGWDLIEIVSQSSDNFPEIYSKCEEINMYIPVNWGYYDRSGERIINTYIFKYHLTFDENEMNYKYVLSQKLDSLFCNLP